MCPHFLPHHAFIHQVRHPRRRLLLMVLHRQVFTFFLHQKINSLAHCGQPVGIRYAVNDRIALGIQLVFHRC